MNRRIDIAVKNNWVNARLYSSGAELPRLVLDPGQQDTDERIFIGNARWQLQNSAVRASIKMDGNPMIISGQVALLDEMHLEYPYWRIISTEHSITPDEGHSTKLSMMLVQGLFNEPHYPEITGATITELANLLRQELISLKYPMKPKETQGIHTTFLDGIY